MIVANAKKLFRSFWVRFVVFDSFLNAFVEVVRRFV